MNRWLLIVALAGCGNDAPRQIVGSASGSTGSADPDMKPLPKPEFPTSYDGVPANGEWQRAAKIVAATWAESFNKGGVTAATVTPMKSPDGATAPYLFRIEGMKAGQSFFKGTALVSQGVVANSGGTMRLEYYFSQIGFPMKTRLSIGHLVEMLYDMRVGDAKLIAPLRPDTVDWKYDGRATLTYDDKGALLLILGDKPRELQFDPAGKISGSAL